ncbi:MAG: NAD-dependent epimerase/dehydratase family protein [Ferrovibrio sp.]|uniref:NAD-dependent epimerase/dehydratase family protein n=1 Tax=Ferrovibrio sp. TaxID=1917215 RepID=UPI00261B5223|nr:NAD-dependent epimerase/dehydratase family protein [Ferrovibrio sp.]MCW0234119.1 NAD-dependent epimerase/dehydratase family protein [Ferrovibrio sp.]
MSNTGVFITGAAGFIGRSLVAALAGDPQWQPLVAFDLRPVPAAERLPGVVYIAGDIRDPAIAAHVLQHRPRSVVHLASVVAAGGDPQRDYEIDVKGTETVLRACRDSGVAHLVVTSSGAAYGYHADNPVPLRESDALRGNEDFSYARNKRLVEELLAQWRHDCPALAQTVFRPCTVLGPGTSNQITAMFRRPLVLGLTGTATPFSLIADSDVVAALAQAVRSGQGGQYNLAGDGTLSLRQIALRLGKPYLAIPPFLLKAALWLLHALGVTQLGPQHVKFIQYRPVLDNTQLKSAFGYVPELDASAVFERYAGSMS